MTDRNDRRAFLQDLIDEVCEVKRDTTRSLKDELWTEEERAQARLI